MFKPGGNRRGYCEPIGIGNTANSGQEMKVEFDNRLVGQSGSLPALVLSGHRASTSATMAGRSREQLFFG
jgi:hypothetical protein